VSAFGDGLYPVALAFAVVEVTGSAGDLGLVFMAVLIPRVVFMLGGGVWADRLPRHRVMLAADAFRCAMQALTGLYLFGGRDMLWPLLLLSALYGAGDAFFQPAITGLVPQTVRPERVQQANALLSLTRNSVWLAGPVVAGIVVSTVGPACAFAVDAASFAVSAVFLALMRVPPGERGERTSFLGELRAGLGEV
jgi:MFS family permease